MGRAASRTVRTAQPRLQSITVRGVRRLVLIGVLLLAGCGGSGQRDNELRPPVPVVMTAAIQDDVVRVSPRSVGAGPITLVVANQTDAPQTVRFETDELGSERGGNRASSPEIAPRGTGRLTIDAREGTYAVRVSDEAIRAAQVEIGPERESGQDRVLLP
jgi:hypothetical protein